MKVHNLMEEIVTKHINELYDNLKKNQTWLNCDCENCRADTICYVLNRIQPKYVISSRGITHFDSKDIQMNIDLDAIGIEGIRAITSTTRPYHNTKKKITKKEDVSQEPSFSFPIFQGTIIDGSTFEPINNATITLKLDGKPVKMRDVSWSNPTKTFKTTKGNYSFWAASIPAKKAGETKSFNFVFEAEVEGYTPVTYVFELKATSEVEDRSHIDSMYTIKVQEIYLFKEEVQNPME